GVRDYHDPLPATARTIAHELNELGYTTAFFGKWHLGERDKTAPLVGEPHARPVVPAERRGGFGFWEGFEGGFLLNDPWLHGTRLPEPVQCRGYQSDVVGARAATWLTAERAGSAAEKTKPWFCVVSLEAPHPPYDAPASGIRAMDPSRVVLRANVPASGEVAQRARRELAGYYAHIEATDRAIGRLVASLDEAEECAGRPAPIVVFTSVHGDMQGAHGLFRKGWPHEESVRVPLLVRTPESRSAPLRDEEPVSLLELAAWTRAWASGAPLPPRMDASRISMPSVVALPHQCDRVWCGVRTRRRKLVLNEDGSPWCFFDLEHDPLEQRNLVHAPEWAAELERLRRSCRDDGERAHARR
ncbi:MAG TPA: sulfatase-like hydrolase/transferase, partial [Opitutus sp.]|nr:sulfatase-like hydrolase/transferase [Opitutus sp.]